MCILLVTTSGMSKRRLRAKWRKTITVVSFITDHHRPLYTTFDKFSPEINQWWVFLFIVTLKNYQNHRPSPKMHPGSSKPRQHVEVDRPSLLLWSLHSAFSSKGWGGGRIEEKTRWEERRQLLVRWLCTPWTHSNWASCTRIAQCPSPNRRKSCWRVSPEVQDPEVFVGPSSVQDNLGGPGRAQRRQPEQKSLWWRRGKPVDPRHTWLQLP